MKNLLLLIIHLPIYIYRVIHIIGWTIWNFKFPKKFYFQTRKSVKEYSRLPEYAMFTNIWTALFTFTGKKGLLTLERILPQGAEIRHGFTKFDGPRASCGEIKLLL